MECVEADIGSVHPRMWVVSQLSPLMVVLALVAAAAGCKRTPETEPGGSADSASAAPPSAGADDPTRTKTVTAKDCEAWAEHGVDAFLASIKVAVAACPPAAGDAVVKTFVGQIVTIRGAAENTCKAHLGESYVSGVASCYMNASDALTLRACRLAPMTNPSDDDWGASLKSIHDNCAIGRPGTATQPPPGAGPKGSPPL